MPWYYSLLTSSFLLLCPSPNSKCRSDRKEVSWYTLSVRKKQGKVWAEIWKGKQMMQGIVLKRIKHSFKDIWHCVSNSLEPHGLWSARLLYSLDSPGKNTGVGCYFLLQEIFPTQELNPSLLHLCNGRQILYHCTTWEAHVLILQDYMIVKL